MSQSPNTKQDETAESRIRARSELSTMIKQGRSFSGHEKNSCFLNLGQQQSAAVSAVTRVDFADDGRALAVVDWDHDGDLDYWTSNRNAPRLRLMRNQARTNNAFLSLKLIGNGTQTNRDAIGARVEVTLNAGHKPMAQTLRAGDAFLSQSSKWLHFGLGKATKINNVVVSWPGNQSDQFTNFRTNQRYELVQGTANANQAATRPEGIVLASSSSELPSVSRASRIPLVARLIRTMRKHITT